MNKVIKFIAKVLDDGETTYGKSIKLPFFKMEKIGMWTFITTSWFIPLAGTILAGTFMDVDSRDFNIAVLPLLVNTVIILILFLCKIIKESDFTKKELASSFGIALLVCLLGLILFLTN